MTKGRPTTNIVPDFAARRWVGLRGEIVDARFLHMAAARDRIVLVLDALNQLEDRNGAPDLVWLPRVTLENVRLIVSTLPGRPLEEVTKREWPRFTEVTFGMSRVCHRQDTCTVS